jgi:branched-chain amino acid transport system substrate-binding protein
MPWIQSFERRPITGLPGITINTSPTDYAPITAMQLARFDGETWVPFGDVLAR